MVRAVHHKVCLVGKAALRERKSRAQSPVFTSIGFSTSWQKY